MVDIKSTNINVEDF